MAQEPDSLPAKVVIDSSCLQAWRTVADQGGRLGEAWHLTWPDPVQQAVFRLLFDATVHDRPALVAVVGGASSGKSTVFNNLLGGALASRITAKGHCTVGPILAVHELRREWIEPLLDQALLLPELERSINDLDDNVTGAPGTLVTVFHRVDALRDILLFDTPDFTSEAATLEGDVTMALLPWFDKLAVVVDHERWYDRQSISDLRTESTRYDQDRFVLFNRTQEGRLAASDEAALRKQADRLAARGMGILEFRRGRGFCQFAPGTLDRATAFLQAPARSRTPALQRHIAEAAHRALNQNEEREARFRELQTVLVAALERALPTSYACRTAMMTAAERRQLEVAARVLRIQEATEWVRAHQERFRRALTRVPVLGSLVGATPPPMSEDLDETTDRVALAQGYYETVARQQVSEVQWTLRSSAFWDELRRWTSLEPAKRDFTWQDRTRDDVRKHAEAFDAALAAWTAKVEAECKGVSPHLQGAIGVGVVALSVVLLAAPGPVAALTLVSAKGAIGAALGKLAAAAGAGAVFGKHAGRLTAVIREKLLGSPEFRAVQGAAAGFREQMERTGRQLADDALAEARALVMDADEPLFSALEVLREPPA